MPMLRHSKYKIIDESKMLFFFYCIVTVYYLKEAVVRRRMFCWFSGCVSALVLSTSSTFQNNFLLLILSLQKVFTVAEKYLNYLNNFV